MEKSSEKLEELRTLYREKRYWEFKLKFWTYAFALEKEDREKVYKALNKLTSEQTRVPQIVEDVFKELGGKLQ